MITTTYHLSEPELGRVIADGGARVIESDPSSGTVTVRGHDPAWMHQLLPDLEGEMVEYDCAAIEAALMRLGATTDEADALTTILHEEGWGGAEEPAAGEAIIADAVLASQLEWLRERQS